MKYRHFAFPGMDLNAKKLQDDGYPEHIPYFGMTLRDYFAAQAMQGLLSTVKDENWHTDEVVSIAYEVADEMIKQGDK